MTQREDALTNEARVLELRAQGLTVDQIAADPTVGITTSSGVSKALRRGLERRSRLGAEELVTLSLAQLDEIDAAASALVTIPGVGAGEIIRALDLRRKVIESKAKLTGVTGRNGEIQTSGAGADLPFPDAGNGALTILDLSDAPTHVLPDDLEAVGVVPDGVFTIGISPDWQPDQLVRTFASDGRLLRGNVLFRAQDMGPWLEWLGEQREARWAAQHRMHPAPSAPYDEVENVLIVDP